MNPFLSVFFSCHYPHLIVISLYFFPPPSPSPLLLPAPLLSTNSIHFHSHLCRSLLGLLTASIMEVASNFQNVAFQLVRSIVDAKIIVPEVSTDACMYVRYASPLSPTVSFHTPCMCYTPHYRLFLFLYVLFVLYSSLSLSPTFYITIS
jgi:hypothetical protein